MTDFILSPPLPSPPPHASLSTSKLKSESGCDSNAHLTQHDLWCGRVRAFSRTAVSSETWMRDLLLWSDQICSEARSVPAVGHRNRLVWTEVAAGISSEATPSEACVWSAGCCPHCRPCPVMIFGFLFFKQRSIISLFETPVGEETSVFAAISGEHIRDSAGLTVADKSCMINTLTRACTHRHTPFQAGWWWRSIVGGTTDVWVSADNQPSN